MLRFGRSKVAKEKFYGAKEFMKICDVIVELKMILSFWLDI